jgi:hypothetical protein
MSRCLVLPMTQAFALPGAGAGEICCQRWPGGVRWDIEFYADGACPIFLTSAPLDGAAEQLLPVVGIPNDTIVRTYWRCSGPEPLNRWLRFTLTNAPGVPRLSRRACRALVRLILEDRWPRPGEFAA